MATVYLLSYPQQWSVHSTAEKLAMIQQLQKLWMYCFSIGSNSSVAYGCGRSDNCMCDLQQQSNVLYVHAQFADVMCTASRLQYHYSARPIPPMVIVHLLSIYTHLPYKYMVVTTYDIVQCRLPTS